MQQSADERMLGKVTKQAMKINIATNEENREKAAASNMNKFFNTDKINDNRNKLFPSKQVTTKDKSSEIGHLFRTDFKPRTLNSTASLNNFKKNFQDKPQTTVEKIVDIMKKIKDRLNLHNELDLMAEVEWVTKEILSNNIYKLKVEDKDGKEDTGFFDEYSNIRSEKLFNKDIIKSGNFYFVIFSS